MVDGREALRRLIEERREDYSALSRLIGRNAAYIQQYIKRGTPRRLSEEDRRRLSQYFGVPESVLGGPVDLAQDGGMVVIPRLDVGASAGSGAFSEEERASALLGFDRTWLRGLTRGDVGQISMIRVAGDSMAPTLNNADEILVDGSDAADRLRDGIYVLRIDDALVVKRIALRPALRRLAISSDNPAYPGWPACALSDVDIVGRVIWVGRPLR